MFLKFLLCVCFLLARADKKIELIPSDILFVICNNGKRKIISNKIIKSLLHSSEFFLEDIKKYLKSHKICDSGPKYMVLNRKIPLK